MTTAIEFNDISKQYRLGLVSTRTLSHDLNRWWQTSILHKEDPYLKIGSVNDRSTAADSEYRSGGTMPADQCFALIGEEQPSECPLTSSH